MRWNLSTRLSGMFCAAVTLLLAGPATIVSAQSPDQTVFNDGESIFQHEWEFQAAEQPAVPESVAEMRRIVSQLSELRGDGLGPMHNATSCEACHAKGGASGVEHNVTLLTLDPRNVLNTSEATRDALLELYPGVMSPFGILSMDVVVHEKSTRPFYETIRKDILQWVPGYVPDGWYQSSERTSSAVAAKPVLAGRKGQLDFYLSQRNSPPLFGLGQIDMIETSRLNSIARSQARRTNGSVSGRLGPGKFGWRAQTATLDQFVRGACAGELGLQVMRTPQPADAADETYVSFGTDLNESEVGMLVSYVRDLPAPRMESHLPEDRVAIREGKSLFAKIGCAVCHVEHVYPARGIYSDLLLHDMGPLLQAPSPAPLGGTFASASRMSLPRFSRENPLSPNNPFRFSINGYYGTPSSAVPMPYRITRPAEPQFPRGPVPALVYKVNSARDVTWDLLQREWRTPPLWGVADSAPYLHDGRAETLDAAIRWHGGEASEAATGYRTLQSDSRKKVIAFLASMRAPAESIRQTVDRSVEQKFALATDEDENDLQAKVETLDVFNPF